MDIHGIYSTATEGHSQISLSLDPQPALIGEDVGIRCTVMQIEVQPRIAVNDKEETTQTLANRDRYTLTSSTISNGVVYVLTLHNVGVSDNGTRFECYVRSSGRRITSGTRVLRVVQERITVTKGIGCGGMVCMCVCKCMCLYMCSSGTRVLSVGYKGRMYTTYVLHNIVHTQMRIHRMQYFKMCITEFVSWLRGGSKEKLYVHKPCSTGQ